MRVDSKNIVEHLGEIDLFICSSGFESRSTKLAMSLDENKIKTSIVFHLDETYKVSSENLRRIKDNLKNILYVQYPKNNSLETFDLFYKEIKEFTINYNGNSKPRIVIDVSTFTREVLLIFIKVLSLNLFSNFDLKVIYTPNESYSDSGTESWMTKGIREIRSILGYSGLLSPSKKSLLIVLNGFEEERTEHIIQSFEPYKILVGKPSKSGSINNSLNSLSCKKFDYIKNRYQNLIEEEFEFSCVSIHDTYNVIKDIARKYEMYNIIISPLNNKISTLGVALAALENENIQICYASANQYNIDSNPLVSDYFLLYDINFNIAK
ncbi:hypothetical protein CMU25_18830 [Elizabethkingia anophelis]|nr:hypothetical protein [Elizabethkingia anophelis]MDV3776080.1 hypothetical protein [Elizabethkingia anophelis]MDV3842374.1 hypothetical protein [Elizabethkingia anophelis]